MRSASSRCSFVFLYINGIVLRNKEMVPRITSRAGKIKRVDALDKKGDSVTNEISTCSATTVAQRTTIGARGLISYANHGDKVT